MLANLGDPQSLSLTRSSAHQLMSAVTSQISEIVASEMLADLQIEKPSLSHSNLGSSANVGDQVAICRRSRQ